MRNKERLKRLTADWPAKVLSLGAALLLFFLYRLNRLEERRMVLPLTLTRAESLSPINELPRSVRLRMRGESNALFAIQEDDIVASLDLSACHEPGAYRLPVKLEKRGSAINVDPLEIRCDPADVEVNLEKTISKIVPVKPSFKGVVESGYDLVSFSIDPERVEIQGPETLVVRVVDIPTDEIELGSRSADFSAKVRLDNGSQLVDVTGSEFVQLSVAVRKIATLSSFGKVAIALKGLDRNLELDTLPPLATLRLRFAAGEPADFRLPPDALSVELGAYHRPGTYTVPVLLRLPDGTEAESYEPMNVTLILRARKAQP